MQLGCPLGTVRQPVGEGAGPLRRRLTRRGSPTLVGLVVAALGDTATSARTIGHFLVPPALVHSTVRAAAHVGVSHATEEVVSGVVNSLVQQVLWRVTMVKISIFVISVALVGSVGFGTRVAMSKGQIAQAPTGPTEKSVPPDQENLAERLTPHCFPDPRPGDCHEDSRSRVGGQEGRNRV